LFYNINSLIKQCIIFVRHAAGLAKVPKVAAGKVNWPLVSLKLASVVSFGNSSVRYCKWLCMLCLWTLNLLQQAWNVASGGVACCAAFALSNRLYLKVSLEAAGAEEGLRLNTSPRLPVLRARHPVVDFIIVALDLIPVYCNKYTACIRAREGGKRVA
jgi:hypothetical protein